MDPEPDTNGQTDLDAFLERLTPERREAFLRSRLRLKRYNENDEFLAIATHLENFAGVIGDLTSSVIRSETAQEIQTARSEIDKLTTAVKTAGEGIAKLETKLKVLDESVDVFRTIERHRLWWFTAAVFSAGVMAIPLIDLLISWIRGMFHV